MLWFMSKIYILPLISYSNFMVSGPIFITTSYWRNYLFSIVWSCLLLCSIEIQNSSSTWGLPQCLSYMEFTCNSGDAGDVSLILGFGSSPEGEMVTHSSILAGKKSHRWRSLMGCSSWGHKEFNRTNILLFLSIIFNSLHQCLRVFTLYVFSLSY